MPFPVRSLRTARINRLPQAAPIANIPPSVTITSPSSGLTVVQPGNVTLTGGAQDPDGSIVQVSVFDNGVFLALASLVTSGIYTYVAVSPSVGNHSYVFVALDNRGATNASNAVVATIAAQTNLPSPNGTKATTITETDGTIWTLGAATAGGFRTLRNGAWVGNGGAVLFEYFGGQVYVQANTNGWYHWSGTTWDSIAGDPSVSSAPGVRIFAGSGQSITDDVGVVYSFGPQGPAGDWTFTNYPVLRNGVRINNGDQILFYQGVIWVHTTLGLWYRDSIPWGVNDPTGTEIFAQTVITPPAQVPVAGCVRANYTEAQLASGAGPVGLVYLAMEPAKLPTYGIGHYTSHTSEYKIFPDYPGVTFARQFSDGTNPDGSTYPSLTMCSWTYHFPVAIDEIWVNWVIMLDPDLKDGLLENGVKLHGLFGDGNGDLGHPSQIAFVRRSDRLTLPARYPLATYGYTFNTSQNLVDFPNEYLYEGVFHSIDIRVKLNTPGVANGEREFWVDDRRVDLETNINFRNDPARHLTGTELLLYQGGRTEFPARNTHIWIGPYTITTPAIGRTGMLRSGVAAWRANKTVDQLYAIPNSDFHGNTGRSGDAIISWSTLCWSEKRNKWYSPGGGGHNGGDPDALVTVFDVSVASPQWAIDQLLRENPAQIPTMNNCSFEKANAHHLWSGMPSGTHNYYHAVCLDLDDTLYLSYGPASYGGTPSYGGASDIYRLGTKAWDINGAWKAVPGGGPATLASFLSDPFDFGCQWVWLTPVLGPPIQGKQGCSAKHRITEDIYGCYYNGGWGNAVRNRITKNWQQWGDTNGPFWNNQGTEIDVGRHMWLCAGTDSNPTQVKHTIYRRDINALSWNGGYLSPLTITGLTGEPDWGVSGFTHDYDRDLYIIAADNGRIYEINPTTLVGRVLDATGAPFFDGTFQKIVYSSKNKCLFICRNAVSNVEFIPRA